MEESQQRNKRFGSMAEKLADKLTMRQAMYLMYDATQEMDDFLKRKEGRKLRRTSTAESIESELGRLSKSEDALRRELDGLELKFMDDPDLSISTMEQTGEDSGFFGDIEFSTPSFDDVKDPREQRTATLSGVGSRKTSSASLVIEDEFEHQISMETYHHLQEELDAVITSVNRSDSLHDDLGVGIPPSNSSFLDLEGDMSQFDQHDLGAVDLKVRIFTPRAENEGIAMGFEPISSLSDKRDASSTLDLVTGDASLKSEQRDDHMLDLEAGIPQVERGTHLGSGTSPLYKRQGDCVLRRLATLLFGSKPLRHQARISWQAVVAILLSVMILVKQIVSKKELQTKSLIVVALPVIAALSERRLKTATLNRIRQNQNE